MFRPSPFFGSTKNSNGRNRLKSTIKKRREKRDKINVSPFFSIMPQTGIEPVREYKSRRILSPVRLPVPPRRHFSSYLLSGTNRARTYDPLLVRQMLSQLSYDPMGYEIMYLLIQATRKGLEPSTSAVTGRRSNQLSHRAI